MRHCNFSGIFDDVHIWKNNFIPSFEKNGSTDFFIQVKKFTLRRYFQNDGSNL